MTVHLRPGISYGIVGGRPIFLDVSSDRYFALSDRLQDVFGRVVAAGSAVLAEELAGPLIEAGILLRSSSEPVSLTPCTAVAPSRTLAPTGVGNPKRSAARFLLRQGAAMLSLRVFALSRILARLPPAPRPINSASLSDLERDRVAAILSAVRTAGYIVSASQRCLAHSIALTAELRRHDIPANLVIGVSLGPFAAHSWAQIGDIVLNDSVEHVQSFTPVLVA
jgi:hypothetical protein